ncbi:hypothetical protein [Streptomyces olivaceus]|uniref:hypothetical protein n=1 Tax=Streptomyces olivaceus TaxID=47716 RepID=UPI0022EF5EF4|nr:hypothetical protein [Streptomyces olivaceus]GHI97174.1 hypothetical protein TPA0905_66450 [Streptomyces olivaceus]
MTAAETTDETTGRTTPGKPDRESPVLPPIPWFGPTLHELVPGIPLGTRPLPQRRRAATALSEAKRGDPVRHRLLDRADQASRTPVTALVAEMLTPPLSPPEAAPAPATEEHP